MAAAKTESVQCFGRKKTAVAVTHCKRGRGLIKINGVPIELVQPEILRYKAFEPILLLGRHRFAGVDMRIRVKGGGHTSQIYAIRQSIAKALVAFYQKYVDEQSKKEIKDILVPEILPLKSRLLLYTSLGLTEAVSPLSQTQTSIIVAENPNLKNFAAQSMFEEAACTTPHCTLEYFMMLSIEIGKRIN
ncbi:unnamed protein product [Fraxinus pennsylvanica]|uniref:Ribosomal protein S16 n=1 Tax=Fraxinus pennsylvanica TaxID=56036 RepID=A0AAD2A6K8_9LAMI|nr:unnamed protein product [Fraxinus pennsylvanica]